MKELSRNKEYFLALIIAVYCAYDLISSLATVWGFTTDDAYISWIYARQLISGNGLYWHNTMPVVEGYSNFLWVFIAALIMKLKLPLIVSIKSISCVSLFAGLVWLYRLGRLFFSPLLAVLPVFIFSHYYGVAWWAVSGLETTFYWAMAVLLIWQCAQAFGYTSEGKISKFSNTAWVITNCCLLLIALTRFEGLVWAVPVAVFGLCQLRTGTIQIPLKSLSIITLICFIIPYAVYFLWRLYYFGHLIPHSFACKAANPSNTFLLDFDYLLVIAPLLILSVPYLVAEKDCRHWLLTTPSIIYGIMLWQADPIVAYSLRLFLAPFAVLSVLPVLGVWRFFQRSSIALDPKLLTTMSLILVTCVLIPGNDTQSLSKSAAYYQDRNKIRQEMADILNQQAAKGSTVLLDDCGITPFTARTDLRFIDALCLNNPSPFSTDIRIYAEYIEKIEKPDWVITDYYALLTPGEFLITRLQKTKFFSEYQLVKEFPFTQEYVYRLYKRR